MIYTSSIYQYVHPHILSASTPVVCHIQPLLVNAVTRSVTATSFSSKNAADFQSLFVTSSASTTPSITHPTRHTTYIDHGIIACLADINYTGYTYIPIYVSGGVHVHLDTTSTTTRAAAPMPVRIDPS